ncbi:hypothetical protein SAMN03159382_02085 [Pseudomonas sp. NFACC23-1]|uniref:hypothetical protein n=1 Tax=unclassified Pseudomonas TaxID=196821 RepID=UPI00088A0C3B|nr:MULTISPECIES: hypothetical protein [unclassified Pseudomonas]SDB24367.1 hypothetical protein SAMN03159386_01746 [Pseudomonas sp. NFACC17-2]SEJ34353.1 hypothetical protein SAMN03159382_02085 [Pseudomonas sp. NFACC23-1]SFW30407.1 hypothetical protein SAMN05660640_00826 [Pseudomonas sp. NFACC16-2]
MNNEPLTGLVTGPNLFSYIGAPSLQDHDDIADCNNIATRSADLGHHRYANPKGWFEEYARTLSFLGWSLYDDSIHTRTQHLLTGSVADFLVESAHTMKDTRQANAMIDTLDTLKADHPAILSFDNETQEGETFQIVPARYDSQGNLHIALFKLELSVDIKRRSFLFWNWERRSARIVQRRAFLKLDRRELDSRRALINKVLNEHLMRRFPLRKARLVKY